MIMIDWKEISNLSIGIVALIVLFYVIKLQNSTVSGNTKAINKLANILDKNSIKEDLYREEMLSLSEDTNKKVTEIHGKVV